MVNKTSSKTSKTLVKSIKLVEKPVKILNNNHNNKIFKNKTSSLLKEIDRKPKGITSSLPKETNRKPKGITSRLPKGISVRPDGRLLVQRMINGVRQSKVVDKLDEAILAYRMMGNDKEHKENNHLKPSSKLKPANANWSLLDAYLYVSQLPVGRGHDGGWLGAKSEKKLKRNAEEVMEYFGPHRKVGDITALEIEAYAQHLLSLGKEAGTVNRKLAALSKLLTAASRHGMIQRRPDFARPKEPGGRDKELSHEEEIILLNWFTRLEKPDHHDAVVVLLDTGMRVGELLKLRGSDIDLRSGVLILRDRKAGNTTGLPMTERVKDIIAAGPKPRDSIACSPTRLTGSIINGLA